MSPGVPTKVIAASFGLTAFAVALVAGLAADNPTESIIVRAIVSLIACNVVGLIVGGVAERVVRDAVRSYQTSHPVPAATARPGLGDSAEVLTV